MTGQVHWLPFVILLIAVSPVIVLWLYSRRISRRYVVEETTVRCRAHDNQLVRVTLVRDAASGEPIGIRRCSAYSPSDEVRCSKACLPQFVHIKTAA